MTIIYTSDKGNYLNLLTLGYDVSQLEVHGIPPKMYINMTNQCPCACTFCLRKTKKMMEQNSLWLKEEPTVSQVIEALDKVNWKALKEVTFCGFGEPLMRIDDLLEVAAYIKKEKNDMPIRVNTNGLANLVHGKDTTPKLKGLIDTVSISLNAPTAEEYYALTRSRFGLQSFDAMLEYASLCKQHIPQVVFTVVDIIGEEKITACQQICDRLGIPLRIRPYEE